eukprot:3490312-Amphidinium_carterae.1
MYGFGRRVLLLFRPKLSCFQRPVGPHAGAIVDNCFTGGYKTQREYCYSAGFVPEIGPLCVQSHLSVTLIGQLPKVLETRVNLERYLLAC